MIEPYLFFNGNCAEALAFYQSAIGARLQMMMRHDESPDPCPDLPEGWEKKVMHASIVVGEQVIMASDGMGNGPAFAGFSLSISLPTVEAVQRTYAALADGGTATLPVDKTFWSEAFGMLTDRFGVNWMVTLEAS